jgi:hypothetical protein
MLYKPEAAPPRTTSCHTSTIIFTYYLTMISIIQLFATLAILLVSIDAQATSCRTQLGSKAVARVPTTTLTSPNPANPTQTLAIQKTVTKYLALVSTSTRYNTKTETTTDTTETLTFPSTTTFYQVSTIIEPSTITITSTDTSTTSSTSTTTSATTAGFKNIRDTLNSFNLRRRAIAHPHEKRAVTSGAQGILAATNPIAVTCKCSRPALVDMVSSVKLTSCPGTKTLAPSTKTVYTTLKPTTVTIPYWARTITEIQTLTVTKTIIPEPVSTTVVETSTSSVTTTSTTLTTKTESETTTTTQIIPGPTVYDACKPENIWGPNFRNGGKDYYAVNVANNGPGVASDFKILADGASTAVDCCNACQQFGTCETFIFRPRNRNCFLLSHDGATCSSQGNHPNFVLSQKGTDTGMGYVVGNGNCGFTYSGNSDGTVFPAN